MKDYKDLAEKIVQAIGGQSNVDHVAHCATRLRFILKNSNIDKAKIHSIDGVLDVIEAGGQVQIVIGTMVADVYEKVIEFLDEKQVIGKVSDDYTVNKKNNEKKNIFVVLFNKLIDTITSVFSPIIASLCAVGIIKGLYFILVATKAISAIDTSKPITNYTGADIILYALSDVGLWFLPILVGYSSAKKFKLSPVIGMILGGALIYPQVLSMLSTMLFEEKGLISKKFSFFGIPLFIVNYQYAVIPVIVEVYFASLLDKYLKNHIPEIISSFVVPTLDFIIIIPLTFLIIGPICSLIGTGIFANIFKGIESIKYVGPALLGLLFGAFWQALVIFGLHWLLFPVLLIDFLTNGSSVVMAVAQIAVLAQAGAMLGLFLRIKNKKVKAQAMSTCITGILGITEPIIYGFTLPRKRPFILASISSSIVATISAVVGSKAYTQSGLGVFVLPTTITTTGKITTAFWGTLFGVVVAFFLSAVLNFVFYKPEEKDI